MPRTCLGKAALIMGGWGYEGNHLCKVLTSSDEMRKKPMKSFILSPIGSYLIWMFSKMLSISHIPCCYGNSVVIAARAKPGNKQHPGYATRRASNGKVASIYSVAMVTTFQY